MLNLNVTLEETRFYQEAEQDGRQREAVSLVTRLLTRRLNQPLPEELRDRLSQLSLTQLEDLGEALLDFTAIADLETWLQTH